MKNKKAISSFMLMTVSAVTNHPFPVEDSLKSIYSINGHRYEWKGPFYGGTIHVHHFFGFPSYFSEKTGTIYASTRIWSPRKQEIDSWIGFQDWSRSGGRRGGPFPSQGEWHTTHPKVWINGKNVDPPVWKNPGLEVKTEEVPFEDENYFFREPTKILLNKGWNRVLLKVPQGDSSWKWMFTFMPVRKDGINYKEVEGLKFSAGIN